MKQTFAASGKCMLIIWPFELSEMFRPRLDGQVKFFEDKSSK